MRALERNRTHPSEDLAVFRCPEVFARPGCGKIGKELFGEQQFIRFHPPWHALLPPNKLPSQKLVSHDRQPLAEIC